VTLEPAPLVTYAIALGLINLLFLAFPKGGVSDKATHVGDNAQPNIQYHTEKDSKSLAAKIVTIIVGCVAFLASLLQILQILKVLP
jgi:hypothetical protein